MNLADAAVPPSPEYWLVPACPAIVYMSPAVIDCPRWVPVAAGTSWTRKFWLSVMYRFPARSVRTLSGVLSSAEVAAPPSPDDPAVPVALPATV
jgi:hypothetical protein